MISLRKHIDNCNNELTESTLAGFRSALIAMGECGQRAVPGAGSDLHRNLTGIQSTLSESSTPDSVNAATEQVTQELSHWADRAYQHHEENEREIREIMGAVVVAAASVGDRDQRFTKEIGDLTGRLRGIAEITDLAAIRRSILESTSALKACVEMMAEENKLSVIQLTNQVNEYRARLEKSERESVVDPLTELPNRRSFERRLESQIEEGVPFCLIFIDMDNFKTVNDRHGHLAGDGLLREFAIELQGQFRPVDLVARWGGDEFAVLMSGDLPAAQAGVARIRKWALGEYKIETGAGILKTQVSASMGTVEWKPPETGASLLARADKNLYRMKSESKMAKR